MKIFYAPNHFGKTTPFLCFDRQCFQLLGRMVTKRVETTSSLAPQPMANNGDKCSWFSWVETTTNPGWSINAEWRCIAALQGPAEARLLVCGFSGGRLLSGFLWFSAMPSSVVPMGVIYGRDSGNMSLSLFSLTKIVPIPLSDINYIYVYIQLIPSAQQQVNSLMYSIPQ